MLLFIGQIIITQAINLKSSLLVTGKWTPRIVTLYHYQRVRNGSRTSISCQ
ncbi:Uncharacterised protein [Segatella copri]|nr:Uncharacterised protein [Segatella copri]